MYTVDEAFEILAEKKITSSKEIVRRWLRNGTLKGIKPSSRKEGWRIPEESLEVFIEERLASFATAVVSEEAKERLREEGRAQMWYKIAASGIREGYIEVTRGKFNRCIEHWRFEKEFADYAWNRIQGYYPYNKTKPRIYYLGGAAEFHGDRVLFDENFEDLEEKILFAVIEHIRIERITAKNN